MLIFKELYEFTQKLAKWRRSYPDVEVKLVSITPNVRAGLITFRFRCKSQTRINEGYNTFIQFYNVKFGDRPLSSNCAKILDKETMKPLYFEKISLLDKSKQNYVRVRCGCADFRHRFAWEDLANKCLYGGRPKAYTRKPGSNRPPVNPKHYPGFCKHIWECAKAIEHYFGK